ncbi:acyl-CoA dehydrogenase family protein [Thauera sp.]|uniref:acyl-CoA dehydrogenase family protein n=1 Tax=Thauera sp. TaxID=1905334 RepID=UPI0039E5B0F9
MNAPLDSLAWLADEAEAHDRGTADADRLVPELGRRGLFRIGVAQSLGGAGGDTYDGVEAIAATAERSLTAAFVFWGQRTFIEYLLQSPNAALRERWLPALLAGEFAGATGLSNAMKFLSGIESLQITATPRDGCWRLDGCLPWVTNLRKAGFIVAAAVARADAGTPMVVAITGEQAGVARSDDLDLVALRGSNTAAIGIAAVNIGPEHLLHEDARSFCPAVRPAFLSLQLGMSIGLARAALRTAAVQGQGAHRPLLPRVDEISAELEGLAGILRSGLTDRRFASDPAELFRIRIRLAEIVQIALGLELDASGGRAYLRDQHRGFARRWVEGAFIPVITPSLTQLQGELARQAGTCAA